MPSATDDKDPDSPSGSQNRSRKRVRTGCLNCKRKRRKCDESKPSCRHCAKVSEKCQWPQKFSFKAPNTLSADGNGQMVTVPQPDKKSDESDTQTATNSPGNGSDISNVPPDEAQQTPTRGARMSLDNILNSSRRSHSNDSEHDRNSPSTGTSTTRELPGQVQLDAQEESGRPWFGAYDGVLPISSPESLIDDGIFLPGSQYRQLHQQLRTGILNYARPPTINKQYSPRAIKSKSNEAKAKASSSGKLNGRAKSITGNEAEYLSDPVLSPHQEYLLWQNWVIEVSSWLDKFDSEKHFRHTLPNMAKNHDCLKYSILALSARQLERKDGSFPAAISLALYQKSINCLLPQLQTKNVAVIASCVVLCVLEMFSCSPKAWRRHLDGCASLVQAMNIRGDSGGLEQSLFWVFARMDVCGALISSESSIVPIEGWTTLPSLDADRSLFLTSDIFEHQANYATYLCARVVDLFTRAGVYPTPAESKNSITLHAYEEAWVALFDQIEEWYENRPEEMKEVISLPADPSAAASQPFDTLLFSNAAAISGNQMYHTSALLMLQKKPLTVTNPTKSILWHARKICAISLSNSHHGCWTNCIQPMWIAGQLMSHPSEHHAILDLYKRIEEDTGWGANWRAEDLRTYWGDLTT